MQGGHFPVTTVASARARFVRCGMTRMQRREALLGLLFISPWIVGFLILVLGPFVASFYLSFTTYSIVKPGHWVGIANYIEAFTSDRLFWKSLGNTLYYALGSVPLRIVLGFALALLLNTKVRGHAIWRTLLYIPSVVPTVAITVVWLYLLHTRFGLINYALTLLGLKAIPWLTSPIWSKPALLMMSVTWTGGNMVIFLAGLQGIPEQLYEAAHLDGASAWDRLGHITIPMMTPTIFFNLVMNVIYAFQVFDQAFIMTGGGPLDSTRFFMLHLYLYAFRFFEMGYASALAWVLFVVIFGLTLLTVRSSDRWVFYGS